MFIESSKSFIIFGNSGYDYLIAIGVFLAIFLAAYLFQKIIIARIKNVTCKTKTDVDDFALNIVKNIKPPFYLFVALYLAAQYLALPEIINKVIFGIFIAVIALQAIFTIQKLIDYILKKKLDGSDESNKDSEAMTRLIGQILKIALWVIGALLVLSNLGINITSLVAGLGIGGIAIALAAQNIFSDIFASFSIFTDQPFVVGDFIKVDKEVGTVKKIGIKTTRIKTVKGNELIYPNKKLTDSIIHNLKRMEGRRIIFSVGVTYETGMEKLEKVSEIISEVFKNIKGVELERVAFKEFGGSSLNFEIMYYVKSSDYNEYMQIRQKINFGIYESFEKEKIQFAYPTQKIFLDNNNQ